MFLGMDMFTAQVFPKSVSTKYGNEEIGTRRSSVGMARFMPIHERGI